MRWLVLLLLLPTAAAQVALEDPEGDGRYSVWAGSAGDPVYAPGGDVDLLALDVYQEGPHLIVQVTQAAPLRDARPTNIHVWMEIDGVPLLADLYLFRPFDDGLFPVSLYANEARLGLDGHADEAAKAWRVSILLPRLGVIGIDVFDGAEVEVLGAEARGRITNGMHPVAFDIGSFDRIPDDLAAGARLRVALDDRSEGGLAIRSELPFRSSNGAATVMVYDALLRNDADQEASVSIDVAEVPDGWQVVAPAVEVLLGPHEQSTVAILAALPSRHVHGTQDSFLVKAQADDGRSAQTRLGVEYPAIPEPSGHHPRVHVGIIDSEDALPPEGVDPHLGNWGELFLSAAEIEPSGEPVAARSSPGGWRWSAQTAEMTLGIDVDLARTGLLDASLLSPVGMVDVRVEATLTFGGAIVGQGTVDVGELPRDELIPISLPLLPWPKADLVPAGPGNALSLEISLEGERVYETEIAAYGYPHLAPGATMLLPLLEYHDPVEQRFSRGDDLDLAGNTTRRIVPEGVGIFSVTVTNDGERGHALTVQTISTVAEPRLLGPSSFRLGAGETREVLVAMDAPSAGQADAVLLVSSRDDAEQRQALLLRAIVDPKGVDDTAREPDLAHREKESPNLAWALAAASLLALARRRGA